MRREIRIDKQRLDAMMELRDLDVTSLAAKAGMHYNSVNHIRRVQTTSMSGLEKLCGALNCHPFDLIVAEGYPEPFWVAPVSH